MNLDEFVGLLSFQNIRLFIVTGTHAVNEGRTHCMKSVTMIQFVGTFNIESIVDIIENQADFEAAIILFHM